MFLKTIASIRTNNFQDPEVATKIGRLWQDCQGEMAAAFEAGLPFYAVYHDYASDYKGDYSLSLCSISEEEEADFDTADYDYEVFEAAASQADELLAAWQSVWQAEEEGELTRAYSLDFERYEADQAPVLFIAKV